MMDYIDKVGFLPLLDMGIGQWSAEAVLDEDCQRLTDHFHKILPELTGKEIEKLIKK